MVDPVTLTLVSVFVGLGTSLMIMLSVGITLGNKFQGWGSGFMDWTHKKRFAINLVGKENPHQFYGIAKFLHSFKDTFTGTRASITHTVGNSSAIYTVPASGKYVTLTIDPTTGKVAKKDGSDSSQEGLEMKSSDVQKLIGTGQKIKVHVEMLGSRKPSPTITGFQIYTYTQEEYDQFIALALRTVIPNEQAVNALLGKQ